MLCSLVLATLMQVATFQHTPSWMDEFEFAIVQENWVIDQSSPTRLSKVFSKEDTRLILRLGCGTYACREEAEEILRGRGMTALPLLLWGNRMVDKEIAMRCQTLIMDLIPKSPKVPSAPEYEDID